VAFAFGIWLPVPEVCGFPGCGDTYTRGPIKGTTSDPPVISRQARTHDQRGTRLGDWWSTRSDVREDVRASAFSRSPIRISQCCRLYVASYCICILYLYAR